MHVSSSRPCVAPDAASREKFIEALHPCALYDMGGLRVRYGPQTTTELTSWS